jgi:hypothetical protein
MERETGIEPATNGLGSRDSTTELLPPSSFDYNNPFINAACINSCGLISSQGFHACN